MSEFLKAFTGTNRTIPIWFMRQVGRYLPEYIQLKKHHPLKQLFHKRDFIVEATLLGPKILDTDAAILFSDILVILDGLSVPYDFAPDSGPRIAFSDDLLDLSFQSEERFLYLTESILSLKQELKIPLIGFAGSPFTIACYLIDGGSSKDFKKTGIFMNQRPKTFSLIIDRLVEATISYLEIQIEAGVDAVQLFDSCTYRLSSSEFLTYCVEPNKKIISRLKEKYNLPFLLFSRNSSFHYQILSQTKADCLSIDWLTPLEHIQTHLPSVTLQGNMDPLMLCSSRERIRDYLDQYLIKTPNYIFNTGHGLVPETDVNNVKFTIDYVRSKFQFS